MLRERALYYLQEAGFIYLQDSSVEILGLKFYGSPWQPEFGRNWAFNLPRNSVELEQRWAAVPTPLDVLVTHGPPDGPLSWSHYVRASVGCELLARYVREKIRPRVHIFGHVHGGYGVYRDTGPTEFHNVATCDEEYAPINPAHVIDLTPCS